MSINKQITHTFETGLLLLHGKNIDSFTITHLNHSIQPYLLIQHDMIHLNIIVSFPGWRIIAFTHKNSITNRRRRDNTWFESVGNWLCSYIFNHNYQTIIIRASLETINLFIKKCLHKSRFSSSTCFLYHPFMQSSYLNIKLRISESNEKQS